MIELIFSILGGSFLIALGILAVRAVNSRRRADRGVNVRTSGDYVGGDGTTSGDYVSGGSALF